jgi:hypothetical protein
MRSRASRISQSSASSAGYSHCAVSRVRNRAVGIPATVPRRRIDAGQG